MFNLEQYVVLSVEWCVYIVLLCTGVCVCVCVRARARARV